MKKIFKMFVLSCVVVIGLCSFTIEKTLTNKEHNQTLSLYQNGKCVISGPNLRGSGTYDIKGSIIYFSWDNGVTQQGKYLPTGSFYRTPRICVEGVCYDAGRGVSRR
ncbi:MAG: hypothetical protein NC410_04340 [Oscillibacter sp.]|nr:hypothetical protein [Oscillibacter sp.]